MHYMFADAGKRGSHRLWILHCICLCHIGANLFAVLFWQRSGLERRRIGQCQLSCELDRPKHCVQAEYDIFHGIFEETAAAEGRHFSHYKSHLCFGMFTMPRCKNGEHRFPFMVDICFPGAQQVVQPLCGASKIGQIDVAIEMVLMERCVVCMCRV